MISEYVKILLEYYRKLKKCPWQKDIELLDKLMERSTIQFENIYRSPGYEDGGHTIIIIDLFNMHDIEKIYGKPQINIEEIITEDDLIRFLLEHCI